MTKLNLGSGDWPLDGYDNVDLKDGRNAYPLDDYDEGSCDEIRASHILEHWSHRDTAKVLADWVSKLKEGGILKIAVPDFEEVVRVYLGGEDKPIQAYIHGGHVDDGDHHGAVFDRAALEEVMRAAGLTRIETWESDSGDCAGNDISLNLRGTRQTLIEPKIGAAMSVPRLGFMDNFFSSFAALVPLGIQLRRHSGAFWGQCIERCFEEWVEEGVDFILAIDYDSVFDKGHVARLARVMCEYPEIDALAPIQSSRTKQHPLMTLKDADGKVVDRISHDVLDRETMPAATAHFGLTMIRVSALKGMPKPWFKSSNAPDGTWGEGRVDDDIYFWKQWERHGRTLHIANRVPIGHAELQVTWPGEDMTPIQQHPTDFFENGVPKNAWR